MAHANRLRPRRGQRRGVPEPRACHPALACGSRPDWLAVDLTCRDTRLVCAAFSKARVGAPTYGMDTVPSNLGDLNALIALVRELRRPPGIRHVEPRRILGCAFSHLDCRATPTVGRPFPTARPATRSLDWLAALLVDPDSWPWTSASPRPDCLYDLARR